MAELIMNDDVMLKIFSRLSLKSLCSFKCVSKEWRKLINNSEVVIRESRKIMRKIRGQEPIPLVSYSCGRRMSTTCLSFIRDQDDDEEGEDEEHLMLEAHGKELKLAVRNLLHPQVSSEGLVYFTTMTGRIMIVNPITRESCMLPAPPFKNSFLKTFGFGFDRLINRFKVVCFVVNTGRELAISALYKHGFEVSVFVHVLGTNSWTEKVFRPYEAPPLPDTAAVFAYGCLHWLSNLMIDRSYEVISYDLNLERFDSIPYPQPLDYIYDSLHQLVHLKGELAFISLNYRSYVVDIFLMGSGTDNMNAEDRWVRYCRVNMNGPPYKPSEVVGLWKEDELLVKCIEDGRYMIYNLKTGVVRLATVSAPGQKPAVFIYQGSLISIHNIIEGSNALKLEIN